MNQRKRQRGMSMFNLSYVLFTVAIFGYIGLKLFPIYFENLKIENSIDSVLKGPSVEKATPKDLAYAIIKRLDIDNVTRIKERSWKDQLTIKSSRGHVTINVKYMAEIPLFMNIALVAKFNYSASNR
ncbi:MAG: DUF4845 domain-containing protein [Chromatiales bacterium]|jgi:hypothetical protein|nr:DUF4845 domain-containing protein [Chromatiales bacterium]